MAIPRRSRSEDFQVAESFPEAMRQFLLGNIEQRGEALVAKAQTIERFFEAGSDGRPKLQTIMNSPDLKSEPSKDIPENIAFKNEVKDLFRDIVAEQIKIEAETPYGVAAVDRQLSEYGVAAGLVNGAAASAPRQDAWVIGAKLDGDYDQGLPLLSLGDALVGRLMGRSCIGRLWSTSRSSQHPTGKHTHFSADLDLVSSDDFREQMQTIARSRREDDRPLTVYFVFGNTGANCEVNPVSRKKLNRSNFDAVKVFLDAAQQEGWLRDTQYRFVAVCTFHCSPERAFYNDKLRGRPDPDVFGGADSQAYKKAIGAASACAGLIEYTSSKYAQAALFAAALTDSAELRAELEEQIQFVTRLHDKIEAYPDREYAKFNEWVMSECKEEIQQLMEWVDRFFEDTAGSDAIVRRPEIVSRLAAVKIPFALTNMIATRSARVSVLTNVKSMNDTWVRTKGRLGWAISPDCGAAWMELAAMRMSAEADRISAVKRTEGACRGPLPVTRDILPLLKTLDPQGSGTMSKSTLLNLLRELGCDEELIKLSIELSSASRNGHGVDYAEWLAWIFQKADGGPEAVRSQ